MRKLSNRQQLPVYRYLEKLIVVRGRWRQVKNLVGCWQSDSVKQCLEAKAFSCQVIDSLEMILFEIQDQSKFRCISTTAGHCNQSV